MSVAAAPVPYTQLISYTCAKAQGVLALGDILDHAADGTEGLLRRGRHCA